MPKGVYKRKPYKRKPRPLMERFMEKLPPETDGDSCWEWQGTRHGQGYGRISIGGRLFYAHRIAWELSTGENIPEGVNVLHKCDNPPCCNPSHTYLGTQSDNMKDMIVRNRRAHARGETHGMAKVPNWIIVETLKFLKTGVSQAKVAKMLVKKGYPCSQSTISNWVRGRVRTTAKESK